MRQGTFARLSGSLWTVLAAAVMVFGLGQAASAATLSTTLDFSFGNGTCGGGGGTTTCSIDVTWDDGGSAGTVDMTIDLAGLPGAVDLTEFYFNTDPYTVLSLDSITVSIGSFDAPNLINSQDLLQADGDGKFDHEFDFPTGGDRFSGGEEAIFHLSGAGITANLFNSTSVTGGGQGTYCVAGHVQDTGSAQQDSDWLAGSCNGVPLPEPSSLLLFGTGLLGLGIVMRRRRKIA